MHAIPGYRIQRILGEGGMSTVYLAVQEKFGREVALKVMSAKLQAQDSQYLERFTREAQIVARLSHPNIITVYDVGMYQDVHYLAMEYIPGQDLKHVYGNLTVNQRLTVIKQIALALDFAHEKGYLHRDIKPENILLHPVDGHAILTDFGVARATAGSHGLTQVGMALGTPNYMSPEQALGKPLDARSDLYNLGVVLYQMITGTLPYEAETSAAVALMHAVEPVPRLPAVLAGRYQAIIDRAMNKQSARRFASGAEFAEAIDELLAQLGVEGGAGGGSKKPVDKKSNTPGNTPVAHTQAVPLSTMSGMYASKKMQLPIKVRQKVPLMTVILMGVLGVVFLIYLQLHPEIYDAWVQLPNLMAGSDQNNDVLSRNTTAAPAINPAALPSNQKNISGANAAINANETLTGPSDNNPGVTAAAPVLSAPPAIADMSLEQLLAAAGTAVSQGHFVEPAESSAQAYYQQALQLDRKNKTAQDGLTNVGVQLALSGLDALQKGQTLEANMAYERAIALAPGAAELINLRAHLDQAQRKEQAAPFLTQAQAAFDKGNYLSPPRGNAYDAYQQALKLDASNVDARNGLVEIEKKLCLEIERLWKKGLFADASALYSTALDHYPGSEAIERTGRTTVQTAFVRKAPLAADANAVLVNDKLLNQPLPKITTVRLGSDTSISAQAAQPPILTAQQQLVLVLVYSGFSAQGDNVEVQIFDEDKTTQLFKLTLRLKGAAGEQRFSLLPDQGEWPVGSFQLDMVYNKQILANLAFENAHL